MNLSLRNAATMEPTSVECVCVIRVTWAAVVSVAPVLRGVSAEALMTPAAARPIPQPFAAAVGPAPVASASVMSERTLMR